MTFTDWEMNCTEKLARLKTDSHQRLSFPIEDSQMHSIYRSTVYRVSNSRMTDKMRISSEGTTNSTCLWQRNIVEAHGTRGVLSV